MEREKLVDILFVFRILEFVVNYVDFICVTLCFVRWHGAHFKSAVKICLVEQVARISNRKTVSCDIP